MIDLRKIEDQVFQKDGEGRTIWFGGGPFSRGLLISDAEEAEIREAHKYLRTNHMPRRIVWLVPAILVFPLLFVFMWLASPSAPFFDAVFFGFLIAYLVIMVWGFIVEIPLLRDSRVKRSREIVRSAPKGRRMGWVEWGRIIGGSLKPWVAITFGVLGLLPILPGALAYDRSLPLALGATAVLLFFGYWYATIVKASFRAARGDRQLTGAS